jgi:chromosome segregation ATPase
LYQVTEKLAADRAEAGERIARETVRADEAERFVQTLQQTIEGLQAEVMQANARSVALDVQSAHHQQLMHAQLSQLQNRHSQEVHLMKAQLAEAQQRMRQLERLQADLNRHLPKLAAELAGVLTEGMDGHGRQGSCAETGRLGAHTEAARQGQDGAEHLTDASVECAKTSTDSTLLPDQAHEVTSLAGPAPSVPQKAVEDSSVVDSAAELRGADDVSGSDPPALAATHKQLISRLKSIASGQRLDEASGTGRHASEGEGEQDRRQPKAMSASEGVAHAGTWQAVSAAVKAVCSALKQEHALRASVAHRLAQSTAAVAAALSEERRGRTEALALAAAAEEQAALLLVDKRDIQNCLEEVTQQLQQVQKQCSELRRQAVEAEQKLLEADRELVAGAADAERLQAALAAAESKGGRREDMETRLAQEEADRKLVEEQLSNQAREMQQVRAQLAAAEGRAEAARKAADAQTAVVESLRADMSASEQRRISERQRMATLDVRSIDAP